MVVKLWRPLLRVTVNGEDVTAVIEPRLISLTLTDEAGLKSDVVDLILSDHLPAARLEIPSAGAEISVALGYDGRMREMGLFVLDEVSVEGPPDRLRLRAAASTSGASAGGRSALTAQRSRSWALGTTIGALVATIARENGLAPAVAASLRAIALPHLDQLDESDISLLTRVALDHDALCKPGGGRLIFVARGESLTLSGAPMPLIKLAPGDVTRWSMSGRQRPLVDKVVATYQDPVAGGPQEVTVDASDNSIAGAGARGDELLAKAAQTKRLRRSYPTREAATSAAQGEVDRSAREGLKLSISLPGDPDLVAESRLLLEGFRPGVDREWLVTSVTHSIDAAGYRCNVSAEQPG
jgi:hypothetical protein